MNAIRFFARLTVFLAYLTGSGLVLEWLWAQLAVDRGGSLVVIVVGIILCVPLFFLAIWVPSGTMRLRLRVRAPDEVPQLYGLRREAEEDA